ncbi:NAD(P)-binding protein [Mycena maculata]|uniref:NAD(P)-binding protein n=1 Tax=Mycena maculata TaxID=230809 RepID=A0AAD7III6_9AGAR|nr:NAD(P)-binding protein [Mycena maculata]
MTISQSPSAPLVVVVGATGNQGGSVVKALAESDREYRIRGLTRDVTKPAARQLAASGVEMISIALTVDNGEAAREVFQGADVVFVVTNYWEHLDVNREFAEAKMLVDAAKAAGVGLFIWSGLESIVKVSKGKYPNVHHFNGKGEVTEYARLSGIPFINVQSGWYATNFAKLDGMKPKRVADETYVLALPVGPQTLLPVIDTANDYGLFVREAIESPAFGAGSEILTSGEDITVGEMVSQLAQITGKKIAYARINDEDFMSATGLPSSVALEVLESLKYHEECGCMLFMPPMLNATYVMPLDYAGKDSGPSRVHLARPTRTWADFVRSTDWSFVLA